MHYRWQIDDPSLEPLFQKHLSKHSVGAYMLLHRGVGQKFRAVRPEKVVRHYIDWESWNHWTISGYKKADRPWPNRPAASRESQSGREIEISRRKSISQRTGCDRGRGRDKFPKVYHQGGPNDYSSSPAGYSQLDGPLWMVPSEVSTVLECIKSDDGILARWCLRSSYMAFYTDLKK